ncbi:cyclic nucleotide-binding protein [Sphingomonas lenta]|uniref:Cyclic nucleotide-binding protein n=2 Tax=Sphingomonas lenta TaxID=1141887 RepID=A0A2A2SJC7_9SPHN|nr:cyclic nucleotide-binding protein [Sphingomonas lenta]
MLNADNVLAQKLSYFTRLSPDETAAVDQAADGLTRALPAKRDLIREGDPPHAVFLITAGWACRYKTLADGRRQIVAFLLPGDLCDVNNHVLRAMDHAIGALTPIQYVEIGHDRLSTLAQGSSRIGQALWWRMLVNVAVQREWTLNNGQRSALERIGHLFCELYYRLRCVGLTSGTGYAFPLTQNDLAEATGLTPVHVNRTLQEMRATGLIVLKERMLDIPDLELLEDTVLFNPDYLHLQEEGRRVLPERSDARIGR